MSKFKVSSSKSSILSYPTAKPELSLDFVNTPEGIDPAYSFTRNSAATYVGSDGLIKTAAVNQPRFDFDPVTGEYRGLLVEQNRTNRSWFSNVITNSLNTTYGSTLTTITDIPPPPTGDNAYQVPADYRIIGIDSDDRGFSGVNIWTYSLFVYPVPNSTSISLSNHFGGTVTYNLNTLTTSGTYSGTIEKYSNGWYRASYTRSYTSTVQIGLTVRPPLTSNLYAFASVQIEIGNTPTSYIPTSGSAVTRQPDQLVLNKPLNSQGTLYVESRPTTGTPLVADNGSSILSIPQPPNTYTKSVLYYNTDRTLRMSSDGGVPVDSSSILSPSSLNRVSLGFNRLNNTAYINGHLKKFSYYSSPLTEDNLRALTGNKRAVTRFPSLGEPIVTSGLVLNLDAGNPASYPGSGTTWFDLSGSGNNGTLVNGVGFDGGNGGSLSFDGVNDYVNLGNASSLNILNQLTISSWILFVNSPNPSGNPSIVDKWDYSNNRRSYVLGTENGSLSTYVSYDGSFGNRIVCTDTAPSLNVWINLVMTYDNQTLRLYKNSSFITSSSYNQVRNLYDNQPTSVYLMSNHGLIPNITHLSGNIPQVSIYNRALTAQEIQQNFNATRGRFGI
jgi:hypothetical protein